MKVLINVEIIVRELKGKVWLALKLAEAGHRVAIGGQRQLNQNLWKIDPDVYFGGSARCAGSRKLLYRNLETAGARVLIMETEGGINVGPSRFADIRLHPDVLEHVDHYLAWGENQADIVRNHTEFPESDITITGSPRFDLLQREFRDIYKREGGRLPATFEDYLLVITNFTHADTKQGDDGTPDEKTVQQRALREQYLKMIPEVADRTSYTVIVRPHPAEDYLPYRQAFGEHDAIFVEHEGDVRTWISHATALVHCSSTAGIESCLMGTPTFSYRPITTDVDAGGTYQVLGDPTHSVGQLLQLIEFYQGKGDDYEMPLDQREWLQGHIANIESSAAERIVDTVNSLDAGDPTSFPIYRQKPRHILKQLLVSSIGLENTESLVQAFRYTNYDSLRRHFPGLEADELWAEIELFEDHVDLSTIRVDEIGKNMFWISSIA